MKNCLQTIAIVLATLFSFSNPLVGQAAKPVVPEEAVDGGTMKGGAGGGKDGKVKAVTPIDKDVKVKAVKPLDKDGKVKAYEGY